MMTILLISIVFVVAVEYLCTLCTLTVQLRSDYISRAGFNDCHHVDFTERKYNNGKFGNGPDKEKTVVQTRKMFK